MRSPAEPTLVTPEGVPLDLPLAGLGSRFVAQVVDLTVQGVALGALFLALALAAAGTDGSTPSWVVVSLVLVLLLLVLWGYPVAFETLWRGRTLGKAAMGLRVVTREGGPVRFRHALVRAVLGIVDFYLTSGAGAVLSVLFTADNQRLGDLAAGTVVVRERTGARMPAPVTFVAPPGLEGYVATLDVAGLSATEYGAIRSFLVRAPGLPPEVRTQLAAAFARPLAARLRPAPPEGTSDEPYLQCIAAAYQRRHAPPSPASAVTPVTERPAPPNLPDADQPTGGGFVPPG